MTTDRRLERYLPDILEDLYLRPTPDYRNEVLAAAVRTRQRPAWTILGRWLPMADTAIRPVVVPRLPLRAIAVAMLIVVLLLAVLAVVGSRSKVPPPFGVARNGLITWALDGDIYVGDPTSGTTRRVVASEDIDRNPLFSRDGTHLAFLRQVPVQTGQFDLVVTRDDGSAAKVLSAVPIVTPIAVQWATDGTFVLVNDAEGRLTRYFLDGSPAQQMLVGVRIEPDGLQPPAGSQILYERDDDQGALYVMGADGSAGRQLFGPSNAPCACALAGPARWSPDGRSVAFAVDTGGAQTRLFVINADGTGLRQLANEIGVWVENDPAWSPDGTRIAFNRWQRSDAGDWQVRSIAIVDRTGGSATPVGVAPASGGALIEWSPDGETILSLPGTLVGAFTWGRTANGTVARPTLIDLSDGGSHGFDWSVGSTASWQRLAD